MELLSGRGRTGLVTALAAQRLAELAHSSRNRALQPNGVPASPRTYPAMVAVHVALFVTCVLPRRRRRGSVTAEVGALTVLALAWGLRVSAVLALGREWNVTAHVSPDAHVVTSGPYRWMRHPNYTAVMLEFASLPVAVGSPRAALWLSVGDALVLWPRIRAEEALLNALPGYREAFAGVPRFLPLPGRRSQRPPRLSQSRGVSLPKPQ